MKDHLIKKEHLERMKLLQEQYSKVTQFFEKQELLNRQREEIDRYELLLKAL